MFIGIYNFLVITLYPIAINRYIKKRKQKGKEDIERFNERLGKPKTDRPEGKLFWFHGASVGESISMLPLIQKLLEKYQDAHVMVTTGTVTSADIMKKRLPERAFHQYIPLDNPLFTSRFIKYWHPDVVLWFESDFWPAMLSSIKRKNIPLILINGRISNKSFKRWQQFDFISKELLGCFTFCLGQSEEDAYRLKALGAKESGCLGNLKYAALPLPIDQAKKKDILEQIGDRPFWLVSSTHHDEEFKIGRFIKKLQDIKPNLLTMIAPRHPHRGAEIQEKLSSEYGLNVALRSKGEKITKETDVYIADTIGELGIWYNIADLVFIGGSLIPHGGQNFIEPCRDRAAVVVGPHMFSFTDAINRAKKADAIIQVNDVIDLEEELVKLISNNELREAKASLAYNWATGEAKVLDGILDKVQSFLQEEN